MNAALISLATSGRYSSAGLAHSAADSVTEATGRPYVMAFRPRASRPGRPDCQPFTIEPADLKAAPSHQES